MMTSSILAAPPWHWWIGVASLVLNVTIVIVLCILYYRMVVAPAHRPRRADVVARPLPGMGIERDGPAMVSNDEQAELRSLDDIIQRVRAESRDMGDLLREPDEGPVAGRMAIEQQALLASLESRRDAVRRRLGQRTAHYHGDALPGIDDDSGSVAHQGRGDDTAPAVWPEEWTFRGGDQLSEAADVDDPVEALEVGALGAGAEASPSDDTTELADRAAPAPPEEAALTARVGRSPASDDLTVGLPPGADLDRLTEATLDDLIEAELVAIDAGDPESAVIIAAELERRRTGG